MQSARAMRLERRNIEKERKKEVVVEKSARALRQERRNVEEPKEEKLKKISQEMGIMAMKVDMEGEYKKKVKYFHKMYCYFNKVLKIIIKESRFTKSFILASYLKAIKVIKYIKEIDMERYASSERRLSYLLTQAKKYKGAIIKEYSLAVDEMMEKKMPESINSWILSFVFPDGQ